MCDDMGTGKKMAVGMLVMLVFFSSMSNDWLLTRLLKNGLALSPTQPSKS